MGRRILQLESYDLDTKEMHCYNMDFPITYITNKDAHNLWIGTINGLYQFNKVNQELKAVNLDSELGCINTIYQSKRTSLLLVHMVPVCGFTIIIQKK